MNWHIYGCNGRKLFAKTYTATGGTTIKNAFAGQPCKYTLSDLGKADRGCTGYKWKAA